MQRNGSNAGQHIGRAVPLLLLAAFAGCGRSGTHGQPPPVGRDLPTVSSKSAALPGATDAADAPNAPSVAESQSATLTTYRDPINGVNFQYPTVWRPVQARTLPAPEFAARAGPARITQAFSPVGTMYARTNLQALTFSYTVRDGSNAAGCAALPAEASPNATGSRQVTYNGVPYREARGGDAGMCTRVQATVDTTLRGKQCLVFERDFITNCPYVQNKTAPHPLTNQETAALQRQLDAVMASVQIAPR